MLPTTELIHAGPPLERLPRTGAAKQAPILLLLLAALLVGSGLVLLLARRRMPHA